MAEQLKLCLSDGVHHCPRPQHLSSDHIGACVIKLAKRITLRQAHTAFPAAEHALQQTLQLENVATANALQLEPARATPVLSRFNHDAMSSFQVAEPIHYRGGFCR